MINAIIIMSIIGLVLGVILLVGSTVFHVKKDERYLTILENLPGVNCGACGYTGCAGLAKALADGKDTMGKCLVIDSDDAKRISEKLNLPYEKIEANKSAVLLCNGGIRCIDSYIYHGEMDCIMISTLGGSVKSCRYGCVGGGNCMRACPFDVISMGEDNLPKIDYKRCIACGKCVDACPLKLIKIEDISSGVLVACSSKAKPMDTKKNCAVGCIGCKICEKQCEFDAIKVDNFLAVVDREKCTDCNKCVENCPQKTINSSIRK